jgi:hypothetical protein
MNECERVVILSSKGYGEMVANDNFKFPIRRIDGKLLFLLAIVYGGCGKSAPSRSGVYMLCYVSLVFSCFFATPECNNHRNLIISS